MIVKWILEDEYYQLRIGSTNGEINYKDLFRFNKNTESFLSKDNDTPKSHEILDNINSSRSNENKKSTSSQKSPILLKYSSYYNNCSSNGYESKSKYVDNECDYVNDSNKINNNDFNCDGPFNMNNIIYKKYQESKKLSNGNLFLIFWLKINIFI